MSTIFQHTKEYSVYPGEYIPLPETELMFDQCMDREQSSCYDDAVIAEGPTFYAVTIAIGTVKREELLAYIQGQILSVNVFQKKDTAASDLPAALTGAREWHIALPANADAAFVTAVYSGGQLQLYLSKSAAENTSVKIYPVVVY